MTLLEVLYRYEHQPSEAAIFALGKARDVYGVRRIQLDPEANTIRVEYDAEVVGQDEVPGGAHRVRPEDRAPVVSGGHVDERPVA